MTTPRDQLAAALRFARIDAGYDSQAAFARRLKVSRPVISKAENPGQPVPSDALLAAWSEATNVPLDQLANYSEQARSGTPQWFMPYVRAEQEASHLRFWGPLVVPGLLQTADYARAQLSVHRHTPAKLQDLVDARLKRQQVIQHARVSVAIEYTILHRRIGTPGTMAGQCAHLIELVESNVVGLHVVPEGANLGLGGAFAVATKDGLSTVSLTTPVRDITSMAADVVDEALALFDVILGASLPVIQSLEYVRNQEEKWREQS